jgi:DNA-binding NarL/FixJ family response regulator
VAYTTAMPDGEIRILLADAHSLFREALATALGGEPDLSVVAEARDGLQAVEEAVRSRPDVALLEEDLPNCEGVRATRLIGEQVPDCRVILLAAEENQETLAAAVEAGVSGYLTKSSPLTDLIEAARAVHRGEMLVPPRMLGGLLSRLVNRRQEQDEAVRRLARLTRRERQVLMLLAEGGDNDSIAQALVISPQTARTHIQNVLGKLEVHSRLEAAALALQSGIIDDLTGADLQPG